jgi:hypothetical protein
MKAMPAVQLNILEAIQAKEAGILQALSSAETVCEDWADKAYNMLVEWLKPWPAGFRFQIEEFRQIAQIKGLPDPLHNRAFGGIAVRARNAGLIRSLGYKSTMSVKSHRAKANEWEKI